MAERGDPPLRWLVDVVLVVAMVREGIDENDKGPRWKGYEGLPSWMEGEDVWGKGVVAWLVIPVVVFGGDNDLDGSCLG
jgi:hypothetical protein